MSDRSTYAFAGMVFDPATAALRTESDDTTLRPKTCAVLTHLIEHSDRIVSRDELMDACWPNTAVTDDTLVQVIVELRRELGDDAREPRFIKTLHHRGYRFVANLEIGPVPGDVVVAGVGGSRSTDNEGSTVHWALLFVFLAAAIAAPALVRRSSLDSIEVDVPVAAAAREPSLFRSSPSQSSDAQRAYERGLDLGRSYLNAKAVEQFETAIELDPDFAIAHARLGYTYAVLWGRPADAEAALERALRIPDGLGSKARSFSEGWLQIARLEFEEATATFEQLAQRFPNDPEALVTLGKLLSGEDQLTAAISALSRAAALAPNDPWVHNSLGNFYLWTYQKDAAQRQHRRYVELVPDDSNAHDSLGLSLQWFGDYDDAEKEYRRALELRPDFEIARRHLANLMFQTGRYREADDQFRIYTEQAASDYERTVGLERRALLALRSGRYERVAELALQVDGLSPTSLLPLDLALARADVATAESLFETRIGRWPWSDRGRRPVTRHLLVFLGRLAILQGRAEEGLGHIREGLQRRPLVWATEPLEDALGRAYLEIGQHDEAVAEFERVLRINPRYPLAHYHLGLAYDGDGDRAAARSAFGRFLEVWADADADLPPVLDARSRLAAE